MNEIWIFQNLLNICHANVFVSIKIVDVEGVVELDVPGGVLTQAGEEQHELVKGEVSHTVGREDFTDSLSERILLELRTLHKLAVGKLRVH